MSSAAPSRHRKIALSSLQLVVLSYVGQATVISGDRQIQDHMGDLGAARNSNEPRVVAGRVVASAVDGE